MANALNLRPEAFEFDPELDESERGWGEYEGGLDEYESRDLVLDLVLRPGPRQRARRTSGARSRSPKRSRAICRRTSSSILAAR